MPELPEVEVLKQYLSPLLPRKTIRGVVIHRPKVIRPDSPAQLSRALTGATFQGLERRGKYLLFSLRKAGKSLVVLGHLGMTGRFYLQPKAAKLPEHTAIHLDLGREYFIYEDTRYFGRFTLDTSSIERLGPEPLGKNFTPETFFSALQHSGQAIKVKLLDQSLVAGVGNIYASEALFRAGISPRLAAKQLKQTQTRALHKNICAVLREAIRCGSTIPLSFGGDSEADGLFYFGRAPGTPDYYEERLQVYDREGKPCNRCKTKIRRIVQAARSTFYCPRCQPG